MKHNYVLVQAFTYVLSGVFLITLKFDGTDQPYQLARILGVVLIGFSFFMLISLLVSQFYKGLLDWVTQHERIFWTVLIAITYISLVSELIKDKFNTDLHSTIIVWIVLSFVVIIYLFIREIIEVAKLMRNNKTAILILGILSSVMGVIGAASLIINIPFLISSTLWLALGLIMVSIAFLLYIDINNPKK